MKISDPDSLFLGKPSDFQRRVLSVLFQSGFDYTVKFCPDTGSKMNKYRSLKSGIYCRMQKHVVAKANLSRAQKPRILLDLYWSVEDWGDDERVLGKFLDDLDVETNRSGWEYRLDRHLKIMREVAESKEKNNPKCPKCGGLMIEKEMKHIKTVYVEDRKPDSDPKNVWNKVTMKEIKHPHYGEWFWGCLRYPSCRGIKAYWVPEDQDPDVGNIVKDVECPSCGSPMVVRMARRGVNAGKKFLGCSQYPVCKGTMTKEEALALVLMRK